MRKIFCAVFVLVGCHSAVRPDAAPPGAILACESSGKNAYDTYGDAGFSKILQAIFDDPNTNVTNDARGNLAAFLVWAYGGPASTVYLDGKTYQGIQAMGPAHKGPGITSAQYDYFVGHIVVPALISSGVKHGTGGGRKNADDVKTCFAPPLLDPAFKAAIVGQ